MKKTISKVSAFIHLMPWPAAVSKSEKMISVESLPMKVKFFVQCYFPRKSIAFAKERTTFRGISYVITLNDGIEITFSGNGDWELVDCKTGSVPAALVPAAFNVIMSACPAHLSLVRMEKTEGGYVATLSDYTALKLNSLKKVA